MVSSAGEAAEKWIENNPDKVAEWTKGAQAGNGESIDLVLCRLGFRDCQYKCRW